MFEFDGELYRQRKGHATGQKQAPPVACQGGGIVERKFLNTPRDLVFDNSSRVLAKPSDHPVFWSVKDMAKDWSRFIDDVLCLFRGNLKMAQWFFQKLNSLHQEVQFKIC